MECLGACQIRCWITYTNQLRECKTFSQRNSAIKQLNFSCHTLTLSIDLRRSPQLGIPNWRFEIGDQGIGWNWLEQIAIGKERLEQTGIDCNRMEQAGIGLNQPFPANSRLFSSIPACSSLFQPIPWLFQPIPSYSSLYPNPQSPIPNLQSPI